MASPSPTARPPPRPHPAAADAPCAPCCASSPVATDPVVIPVVGPVRTQKIWYGAALNFSFAVSFCNNVPCVDEAVLGPHCNIPITTIVNPCASIDFLATFASAILEGLPQRHTAGINLTTVTPALHIDQDPHVKRVISAVATWITSEDAKQLHLVTCRAIVISMRNVCLFHVVFTNFPAGADICHIAV
jgi:hypothetical protein